MRSRSSVKAPFTYFLFQLDGRYYRFRVHIIKILNFLYSRLVLPFTDQIEQSLGGKHIKLPVGDPFQELSPATAILAFIPHGNSYDVKVNNYFLFLRSIGRLLAFKCNSFHHVLGLRKQLFIQIFNSFAVIHFVIVKAFDDARDVLEKLADVGGCGRECTGLPHHISSPPH